MVEDGHISTSYQYGPPTTYYLDDVTKNNNDNCIVVVDDDEDDDVGGKDETDDEPYKNNDRSTSNSSLTATTTAAGNCINQILPVSESNSKANSQYPLRFEKIYSPGSNGSSHVERTPSQNFFDVTKEAGSAQIMATREHRNFAQEIHKTVFAFLILIFNFFLTTTSLAIIHDKVPKYGPLPDTILQMIDPQDWALIVSEILILVTTSIMLVIITLHKYRFIIFRRLFLLLSLLYFMRSVTMFVTVLPVSSTKYFCSPQVNGTVPTIILDRSLKLFFGMGLTINGKHTYCGDYIYSGHTTILVMSYLMISEYSPKRILWLHWATWCMSLTGVLMVLLSHSHYTVDVIIGYYVTTRLFWMYHTCANNQFLKKTSPYNYLSREWWFFIFQYFECNVKGSLQPLEYR